MKLALLTADNRQVFREYEKKTPWFGPAPTALLEGLAEVSSLEVHVVSCTQQPMQSPAKLAENIHFHCLHVPHWGWLRTFYQGCIRATRRKLRDIQPDIVHGQGTERDCSISAVLSGFPTVLTIHGNMAALARQFHARPGSFYWLTALLENWTLPRAEGVFCNSDYTEALVRTRNARTWKVPNAIRSFFFAPGLDRPAGTVPRFLNIGTITPRKRQLELLGVCRNLRARGYSFQIDFFGGIDREGSYGADFLQAIQEPDVKGYASFSDYTQDEGALIEAFDRADGLVHFPSEEAFGLVVAEALARNLKLFGSAVGGVIEIMAQVEGAELLAPDDWDGLEKAMARWMDGGFPRPATAARTTRERYHPDVIARRHVEIYEEVLGVRSGQSF
jgi:glycosyltransferase involved in cell wall biosynthesis